MLSDVALVTQDIDGTLVRLSPPATQQSLNFGLDETDNVADLFDVSLPGPPSNA
jgi:FMN phosphatase YigB (HAD superfamily)